jgi:hypothetical protein
MLRIHFASSKSELNAIGCLMPKKMVNEDAKKRSAHSVSKGTFSLRKRKRYTLSELLKGMNAVTAEQLRREAEKALSGGPIGDELA